MGPMDIDHNGLEILDRAECLALLKTVPIGRIAITVDALPVILPVNFVLANDEIIMRTAEGAKLSAAMSHAVIALEADHFEPVDHCGWSVLVQGNSRVIDDPVEVDRTMELPLRSWASERTDRFVAVSLDVVTGRRVGHIGERRFPSGSHGRSY
jgi:hypothetical protein